jgi:exosortase D (VPLPA-CTERM-specific)
MTETTTKSISFSSVTIKLLFSLALALAAVAYWGGLTNLSFRWIEREEYSHGFFLPLISLWMLWHRRDAIAQSVGAPSVWGFLVVLAAMFLLFVGEISAIFILIQFSFVLCLMGLVMAFGGFSLLRVCLVPLFLLFFAIPTPYFIDAQLSWWLQLVSSKLGVDMLRLMGVPVHLEGNMIDLGLYKLQVVEACSGLRYLYPLLSLGFIAAYMFSAPLWQRLLVFISVIPITVFMNSFRIAAIGAAVNVWGTDMAEGFLHFFEGWVIFMGCALLLLLEMWILDRFGKRRALSELLALPDVQPVAPSATSGRGWSMITTLMLLGVTTIGVHSLDRREELVPQRLQLSGFPLMMGDWWGREQFLEPAIEDTLGADDYLMVDYSYRSGKQVNFWVAYYASQRKGNSPHSPRVCLPGGGWRINDLSTVLYNPVDGAPSFPVNRAEMEHNDSKQLVYYWLEQRGRRVANEYWAKWYLLLDSIMMNRSDGALVRIVTPIYPDEDVASADRRVLDFIAAALPIIPDYIPNQGTLPR